MRMVCLLLNCKSLNHIFLSFSAQLACDSMPHRPHDDFTKSYSTRAVAPSSRKRQAGEVTPTVRMVAVYRLISYLCFAFGHRASLGHRNCLLVPLLRLSFVFHRKICVSDHCNWSGEIAEQCDSATRPEPLYVY